MEWTALPLAPATSEELAGDAAPLSEALGSPEALASLASLAELVDGPRPDTLTAVEALLGRYRGCLLGPVELPAIRDAYGHAARGEVRELLALDQSLARHFGKSAFAEASRRAGRLQLRRLRPVRDRTLQRYLTAVERGDAHGWHVIVYGLLLARYAFPLRQGLAHYATKTQHSLVHSATRGLPATAADLNRLCHDCSVAAEAALRPLLPSFP